MSDLIRMSAEQMRRKGMLNAEQRRKREEEYNMKVESLSKHNVGGLYDVRQIMKSQQFKEQKNHYNIEQARSELEDLLQANRLYKFSHDTEQFIKKISGRVADVCEFWWVEQYWLNYRNKPIDEYIFAPEITNREQLYEKIRKTFVRVSAELGLYMLNGKRRPLTSIRHTNALKIYEQTHSIEKSAEGINTSKDIIKSNYLNYSDEWARNRFKALGYDKSKNYQNTLKSKNKVKKK